MKLSIVIPCYNEAKNIPLIFEKFKTVINRDDIELLIVNNGSTDNSSKILNELLPKYSFAKLVEVEVNQGYGYGIASGLNSSKGEFLSYTHADLQTDPADVIKALSIAEKQNMTENIFIKGDRKGRPIFDQFFTIGMSLYETLYLKAKLWDINAQPNLFHRSFYEKIKDNCPKDFSLDLFFLYKAIKENLNIVRFDVVFPPRIHGESSWNTGLISKWKFIKRTLKFSTKLKKQSYKE